MSIRDLRPWQRLSGRRLPNNPATLPTSVSTQVAHGFSRRGFLHTAAGATGLAIGPGLSSRRTLMMMMGIIDQTRPAPKPIPGGLDLSGLGLVPPYDFIHVFAAGPGQALSCRLPAGRFRGSTSSQVRSPTSTAPPPWPTTSARRREATGTRTTSRPTSGSWTGSTSPWTVPRGAAASRSYESTCSSPVRARRFTTITAASFCRDSSGRSSFPTGPSA